MVENVFFKYGRKIVKAFCSWYFLCFISYTRIIQAIKNADAKLANTPHIPRTNPCLSVPTSSAKQITNRIMKINVVTAVATARNIFIPSQMVTVKFMFCFFFITTYSSVIFSRVSTSISLNSCDTPILCHSPEVSSSG